MKEKDPVYTNALINESSPYLLQHAHNPVNWVPWSDEAFLTAEKEDKLVLVSIGYSSCHWCHVMEHESFEDTAVAQIMNEKFICIKVDREERPDVDQVYMNAVQLMTGQGGWPLNCFTLPDGRPIYGGTYFPKNKWVDVLNQLHASYQNNKKEVLDYAGKLTEGIQQYDLIDVKEENKIFSADRLDEMVSKWAISFDNVKGGANRAPKFPLPNNYEFLMQYAHLTGNDSVMTHVDLTLTQLAYGGIYDQIGGGFARYATDLNWKIPHFEKMLYDNAQLVSLYAHAYQRTKNPLYKEVVYETLDWVKREMTTKEGAFYSALDADSEGEEGKFYVWGKDELKEIAGEDHEILKSYYNLSIAAQWEGKYILHRIKNDETVASEFDLSTDELNKKIDQINQRLLTERSKRERPGLDDKSLTSWNCLMTTAYLDAYLAFNDDSFLAAALANLDWFEKYQMRKDGKLWHTYKEKNSKIEGFLEDYAFAIQMYVKFYEVTFDEDYLDKSKVLLALTDKHFKDDKSGMYFFTSNEGSQLVARKMELSDNVIPASNSVMANNLFDIGTYYYDEEMLNHAQQMMANVYNQIQTYGAGYSNWGILLSKMTNSYYEIAITGNNWKNKMQEFQTHYIPNATFMGGEKGKLPLLDGKFLDETTIFVCVNKSCQMPVSTVSEALKQIK
ncbi:thioredoxin domain-containing protein [Paracrocinitomix mangrovi]|uniref:thioredoxin domain-containing protein n=1 Tax=Paracrocinitomix mangrovi TaxID=2862509 RepID=UPI001ED9CD97|nr:thioredoxin domain-containing protein [Paracrocinitomix mangrovi]UKN00420.1 thioredoxin domain-containing protein [Paracrocinitomix mangrovi]